MATTPNFNWSTPDNTGLVKNGALDIRTLGNAIDASMADLKGGTTGQVLAKATNTDMDFTWVAQDDSNAIQNAIVDAKGDLIAATANDTPARLAVGANGEMLVADSTAATGLDWKTATEQYPWTAYTASPGNLTVGNGTLVARYQQIGKLVNIEIQFTFGSTSAISGSPTFALPVNAKMTTYSGMGTVCFGDYGVGNYVGLAITPFGNYIYLAMVNTTATFASENGAISATVPFTWTTNDFITIRATYEAA